MKRDKLKEVEKIVSDVEDLASRLLFLKKGKALADDIEKYFERKKKTAAEPARDSSAEEKTAESPAQKEEDPIDS